MSIINPGGDAKSTLIPPEITDMEEYRKIMEVLQSALNVGEGILVYGGETSEVENTIIKICRAYGAVKVSVWAITSLIEASMVMPDGLEVSLSKRIYDNNINLARLQKMHETAEIFIRNKPDEKTRKKLIKQAASVQPFSKTVFLIGALICAFGWCVYFGGTWQESVVSGILGFVLLFLKDKVSKYFNNMATTILLAAISGMLAAFAVNAGLPIRYSMIAISVIMIQIPTLQVANGNRELFGGDIVCGTLKILQAMLTTIAIALGYMIAMVLFQNSPNETYTNATPFQFILGSCLGVLGNAFVFKAPLNRFVPIVIGALITSAIWEVLALKGMGAFGNTYICAMAVTLYAMVFSWIKKEDSSNMLLLPILGILLPGRYFFYSFNYLIKFNQEKFWQNMNLMLLMVLGIVFGIITVTLAIDFVIKLWKNHVKGKVKNQAGKLKIDV